MPPPTITLRGAWSLNRNNSPGWRARNFAADGAQKFTSVRFGCCRSMSNQSPSVTAMTRLIAVYSTAPLRLAISHSHEAQGVSDEIFCTAGLIDEPLDLSALRVPLIHLRLLLPILPRSGVRFFVHGPEPRQVR
jgi:hypothetical protein